MDQDNRPVAGDDPGTGQATPHPQPGRSADASPAEPSPLDRSLAGDLPCVVCGYSLRGLSIRSNCPECGTPVRATILAVVDPLASELQPVPRPRLVGAGLMLWTGAALAAAVLAWVPQSVELLSAATAVRPAYPDLSVPIVVLILLSGVGATAIIAPHRGLGRARVLAATAAVVAYLPLAWVMWRLGQTADSGPITNYLRGLVAPQQLIVLRLAATGLVVVIVLGLRFNARVLVARSLALRQGRVDRQTLAAVAVAAGVVAAGDLIGLLFAGPSRSISAVPALIAIGLIATGAALLTIGLAGAVIDSYRITRSLRIPSPSLRELLAPGADRRRPAAPRGEGAAP